MKRMDMKAGVIVLFISFAFFCGLDLSRAAEPGFPTKSIELMIQMAPGGGTDLSARMIAEGAKQYLGQDIVPINKPGGGGRLAMTLVIKSKPDGYTLGAGTDNYAMLIPLLEKVPYKALEDFTFIIQYGVLDFGVVVMADSPFRSFKDIIDYARSNPNTVTISTSGVGTTNHIAFEAIALHEGVKFQLVPFSGSTPAMTALLGGHVMVASFGASGYLAHLRAKTVRLVAMFGEERSPDFPEVPILKDLGYPMAFQSWYLIAGPRGMDKAVVKRLEDAFRKTVDTPTFVQFAKQNDMYEKKPKTGDELMEGMKRRYTRNEELFKRLGMLAK
jgi:tripartite-type tricarboxylate transporter receptor subunit TctC